LLPAGLFGGASFRVGVWHLDDFWPEGTAARHFETQFWQDFQSFRQQVLTSDPDEETEQGYFDWEMAVAGSSDMQDEIERLSRLLATS